METRRWTLWLIWGVMLATIALYAALPALLPSRTPVWYAAQAAVIRFVLALFSLAAGVGTFALRESLVMRGLRAGALDPATPEGFARVRITLIMLWALCEVIALFGLFVALGSGNAALAAPFFLGGATLLAFHAPHAAWFTRPGGAAH